MPYFLDQSKLALQRHLQLNKGAFISLLILCLTFSLANPLLGEESLKGSCHADFVGSSTMGEFTGEASSEDFTIYSKGNEWHGEISFLVEKMDTYNKIQNKKMFKMLDSKNFPRIIGSFKDNFPLIEDGANIETVSFTLMIKDTEKDILAKVKNWNTDSHFQKKKIKELSTDLEKTIKYLETINVNKIGRAHV